MKPFLILVAALALLASGASAGPWSDILNTQATICYARGFNGDGATIASLGIPFGKLSLGGLATGTFSLDANAVWTLEGDRDITLGPGVGYTLTSVSEGSPKIKLGIGWCDKLGGMGYIGIGWKL